MHNLLRLERLSSLPFSLRRIALSAAKGSLADLIRLLKPLGNLRDMAAFAGYLPVLYANLDPAGIPRGDSLFTRPVQKACVALKAFQLVQGSYEGAGIDLWQRVWPWLTFLHTHCDVLPSGFVSDMDLDPFFFILCFADDEDTTSFIHETPGLYLRAADCWTSFFDIDRDKDKLVRFTYLGHFLDLMDAHDRPANLLELVEATNGPAGFASLVARTMAIFIPDRGTPMSEEVLRFYSLLASFLYDVTTADSAEETSGVDIISALASAGIIGLVTTMLRAVRAGTL